MDIKEKFLAGIKVLFLNLLASVLGIIVLILLTYFFGSNVFTQIIGVILWIVSYIFLVGIIFEEFY